MGTPSVSDLKAMLRMNVIGNNPVTTEDFKIAEKNFGPDIGALKGKTTRDKPALVVNDQIEIPHELIATQRKVTLCIDGMEVNGLVFLTTISKNLYYHTAQFVPRKTPAAYQEALSSVFRIYKNAGFRITIIQSDNEIRPLMEHLSDIYDVTMNFANPQEHVAARIRTE